MCVRDVAIGCIISRTDWRSNSELLSDLNSTLANCRTFTIFYLFNSIHKSWMLMTWDGVREKSLLMIMMSFRMQWNLFASVCWFYFPWLPLLINAMHMGIRAYHFKESWNGGMQKKGTKNQTQTTPHRTHGYYSRNHVAYIHPINHISCHIHRHLLNYQSWIQTTLLTSCNTQRKGNSKFHKNNAAYTLFPKQQHCLSAIFL